MSAGGSSIVNILVRVQAQQALRALERLDVQLQKLVISGGAAGTVLDAIAGAARGYTAALGGASAEAANLAKALSQINRSGTGVASKLMDIGAGAELAGAGMTGMATATRRLAVAMAPLAASTAVVANSLRIIGQAAGQSAVQTARADAVRQQSAARTAGVVQANAAKQAEAQARGAAAAQVAASRVAAAQAREAASAANASAQVVRAEEAKQAARYKTMAQAAAAAASIAAAEARTARAAEASAAAQERAAARVRAAQAAAVSTPMVMGGNSSLAETSRQMQQIGSRAQWVGRQLMMNISTPLALIAGGATAFYYQQEKAFTYLAKVYDGAESDLGDFGGQVGKVTQGLNMMSNYFGVNREEVYQVAEAWASLGMTGGALTKAVQNTFEASLLGNMGLEKATDGLIAIQAQFKISMNDSTQALAEMNAIANQGPTELDGLIDAMSRTGAAAHAAGLTVAETAGMIEEMAPATGTAVQAGNGLKSMIASISAPTEKTSKWLNDIGVNTERWGREAVPVKERIGELADVYDRLTNVGKTEFAAEVAGKWQYGRLTQLLANFNEEQGEYQKAIRASGQATGDAGKAMGVYEEELATLMDADFIKFNQAWQMIRNSLSDAIKPMIPTILMFVQVIASMFKWFANLSPSTRKWITTLAALLIVLGPLVMLLSTVVLGLGVLGVAFARVAPLAVGLGKAMIWALSGGALFKINPITSMLTRLGGAYAATSGFIGRIWTALWVTQGRVAAGGAAANSGIIQRFLAWVATAYTTAGSRIAGVWTSLQTYLATASAAGSGAQATPIGRMLVWVQGAYATASQRIATMWAALWVTQGRVSAGGAAANSGIIQRFLAFVATQYVLASQRIAAIWGLLWVTQGRVAVGGAAANSGLIQRFLAFVAMMYVRAGSGIATMWAMMWTRMAAISVAGSLAAGRGALLGLVKGFIGPVVAAIGSAAAAIAAFVGLPVWAVVAIGVALIAAGAAIWKWRDQIGAAIVSVARYFGSLPGKIMDVLRAIWRGITAWATKVRDKLADALNPFKRHSPSLVDNVLSGTAVISSAYGDMARSVIANVGRAEAATKGLSGAAADLVGRSEEHKWQEQRAEVARIEPGAVGQLDAWRAAQVTLQHDVERVNDAIENQESIIKDWETRIKSADRAIEGLQNELEALQAAADATSDALAAAQDRLSEYTDANIVGEGAMSDAIFDNEMAQKRLRLEIMRLEDATGPIEEIRDKYQKLQGDIDTLRGTQAELRNAGAGSDILSTYDRMIRDLEAQQGALANSDASKIEEATKALEELQRRGERLDLENSLKFDPLNRQIEKASSNMKEMPFDQIISGIQRERAEIEQLTALQKSQNLAVEQQEAKIKSATQARDAMNDSMEIEQAKLAELNDLQSWLQSKLESVTGAINDTTAAAGEMIQVQEDQIRAQEDAAAAAEKAQEKFKEEKISLDDLAGSADDAGSAIEGMFADIPEDGGLPPIDEMNIDEWMGDFEGKLNEELANIDLDFNPFDEGFFGRLWHDIVIGLGQMMGGNDVAAEFEKAFQEGSGGIDWWYVITGTRGGWTEVWPVLVSGIGSAILGKDAGAEFERGLKDGSGGINWWLILTGAESGGALWRSIVSGIATALLGKDIGAEVERGLGSGSGGINWNKVLFGSEESPWQKFKDMGGDIIRGLGEGISTTLGDVWTWIQNNIPIIRTFKDMFGIESPSTVFAGFGRDMIAGLLLGLVEKVGELLLFFMTLPSRIFDALWELKDFLWRKFLEAVDWVILNLPIAGERVLQWFRELPGRIWDALGSLGDFLSRKFDEGIQWLRDNLPAQFWKVLDWFNHVPGMVFDALGSLGDFLSRKFDESWQWVRDNLPAQFWRIANWFNGVPGMVFEALGSLKDFLSRKFDEALQWVADNLPVQAQRLLRWFNELPGTIARELGNAKDWLFQHGRDLVQGMIDGVGDMGNALKDYIGGFFKRNVTDKVKDVFTIGSPSKVFAQIGRWNAQGLIIGMDSMHGQVRSSAQELANQVASVQMPTLTIGAVGVSAPTGAMPAGPMPAQAGAPESALGAAQAGGAAAAGPGAGAAAMPTQMQDAVTRVEQILAQHGVVQQGQLTTQAAQIWTAYQGMKTTTLQHFTEMSNGQLQITASRDGLLVQGQTTFNGQTIAGTVSLKDNVVAINGQMSNDVQMITANTQAVVTATTNQQAFDVVNLTTGMQVGVTDQFNQLGANANKASYDTSVYQGQVWTATRDNLNVLSGNTNQLVSTNFNNMATNLANTFNGGIKPIFDAFGPMLAQTEGWFSATANNIGTIWGGIQPKTADPSRFVINTVYNGGIRQAWNKVNGWLGLPPLDEFVAPFAAGGPLVDRRDLVNPNSPRDVRRGGRLNGPSSADRTLFAGKGGEYVLTQKMARDVGYDRLESWRRAANQGKSVEGAASTFRDPVKALAGGGEVRPGVIDEVFKQLGPYKGRAYDYGGGGGSRGYDCSGWTGAVHKILTGGSPVGRIWTTENNFASFGYKRGRDGYWSMGVHNGGGGMNSHTAGTLDGINFEAGGAHSTSTWGGPAAGTIHPQFENQYYLPALGGVFQGTAGGGTGPTMSQRVEEAYEGVMRDVRAKTPRPGTGTVNSYPYSGLGKFDIETKGFLMKKAAEYDAANAAMGNIPYDISAGVEQWRGTVHKALDMVGQSRAHDEITLRRMQQESSGNPNAINLTDSNAQKGTPSKGLMQVIDPTFDAYRFPGHDNIWAPLDNILASMRYAMSRYGSLPAAYGRAGGYDSGGWLMPGFQSTFNGTAKPEPILTSAQWDQIKLVARGTASIVKNIGRAVQWGVGKIFGSNPISDWVKNLIGKWFPPKPGPGNGGPGTGGPGNGGPGTGNPPVVIDPKPFWADAAAQMKTWTPDLATPIAGLEGVVANLPRKVDEIVVPEWPPMPEIPEVVVPTPPPVVVPPIDPPVIPPIPNIPDIPDPSKPIEEAERRLTGSLKWVNGQLVATVQYAGHKIEATASLANGQLVANAKYTNGQLVAKADYANGQLVANASYAGQQIGGDVTVRALLDQYGAAINGTEANVTAAARSAQLNISTDANGNIRATATTPQGTVSASATVAPGGDTVTINIGTLEIKADSNTDIDSFVAQLRAAGSR